MPGHDRIVIGASAGGVEALMALVRQLPRDLPAAVFVVVHIPAQSTSLLPRILSKAGNLPATHATDGEAIRPGHIYVAPPDRHMLIARGHLQLTRGARENRHRPAIDPLFRSAALAYGPRVVSVVLSGSLDDGAAGAVVVKRHGGVSVVQEPGEALFPGMPTSAIKNDSPDHILPIAEIGALLVRLAHAPVREEEIMAEATAGNSAHEEYGVIVEANVEDRGKPSVFGCPECGGVLWEIPDRSVLHYRCRVGHAYTADSLLAEQAEKLEAALWAALRGLEEKADLAARLLDQARSRGHRVTAARFEEQMREAREQATLVRDVLLDGRYAPPAAALDAEAAETT